MVDAGFQLVQRIEFFAGAEVRVELHHRVGAVKVAGKAGDEGLTGHLGGVIVDGRPGAKPGGRGIPDITDLRAGDVDAEARQLEALRVELMNFKTRILLS